MKIDEAIEYLTIIEAQVDKFQYGIAIGKKRTACQLGIGALRQVKANREGRPRVIVYKLLPGETEE